jgi:pimeloyl-ACP methyl ester carboxylesterase
VTTDPVFPRSRWLKSAGVNTLVAEAGSGPPIVFLHGNPDTHDVWSGVVSRLKADFTCYAPDLPGYGQSDPQGDCSLDQQVAWVAGVLSGLGVEKPHLVVHDVGGNYGLAFATKHPERIGKLTIFNTNFFPDYRWHFWGRMWRTPVVGELVMALGNRPLFVKEMMKASPKLTREHAERAYVHFGRKTRRQVLAFYRYMSPEVLIGWDTAMLKATENVPGQVIWGDLDPYLPAGTADRFGKPVHRFSELGHWTMVETPEAVAEKIRALR